MKKLSSLALILLASQLLTHTSAQTPTQTARGPELYVQTGHNSLLNKIVLSPTGRFAASSDWADRNFVKVWSVKDGKELATLRYDNTADDFIFSPDEKFILVATGLGDAQIKKWSIETGREVDSLKCGGASVELSPDASRALCYSYTESGQVITLWDVAAKKVLWSLSGGKNQGRRLSPDWKRLFLEVGDSLKVTDIESGREITKLSGASLSDYMLANGSWLLSNNYNRKPLLRSVDTGETRELSAPGIENYTIRTDPTSRVILFVDEDKRVAEAVTLDDPDRRVKIKLASHSPVCSMEFFRGQRVSVGRRNCGCN